MVSCPYFEGGNDVDAAVDAYIADIAPLALDNMSTALQYLLASIIYLRDNSDLETRLPADHPLKYSVTWRLMPRALRGKAVIHYPWNKTADTPEITGVPPNSMILAHLEYLKVAINEMPRKVVAALRQEVGLNIGGVNVNALVRKLGKNHKEMLEKVEALRNRGLDGTGTWKAALAQ